jgi:hypothetical protein
MPVRRLLLINILCFVALTGSAQERGTVHSFRFRDLTLRAALDSLMRWYDLPLIYLDRDVAGKRVTVNCDGCGAEEALRAVTEGQGLLWKRMSGQVLIQRRVSEPEPAVITLAGTIRDSLTSEGVFGAEVLLFSSQDSLRPYRWCPTNASGFYSLRSIPAGWYSLHVHRLGFRTATATINVPHGSSTMYDVTLLEEEISYPGITVEAQRSALGASEGISRGVFIRATPSDHNQYLLEGTRIYNPLHVGGVMSAFNVDALRDVQVVAGGVPPYYGGRIGGILDLALRDGAGKGLSGSASTGTLGSSLVLTGDLFPQTSYMISGRQGYPDVLLKQGSDGEPRNDLHSSEIIAKLTYHPSNNQRISLMGYYEGDALNRYAEQPGSAGLRLNNSFRWGNAAVSARWIGVASPSLFFSLSATVTHYGFTINQALTSPSTVGSRPFDSNFLIDDGTIRAHAEYFYDEFHTLLAGVELMRHRMGGTVSGFSNQIGPISFDGYAPWELAVYVQDQWRLLPSVLAELGVRATSFVAQQGSFSAVDPRFSLTTTLGEDFHVYTSLSSVNQFIHPYRNSGVFLYYPSIFLYPSTAKIPPSTSLQFSLGAETAFAEGRYRLSVESYYRTTQNLHEFVYDTTAGRTLTDALLLGEGNVTGAEVTFDKRLGDFTGSVRYGYSWATDKFAGLNGGAPFRPRFDHRHEVYATMTYTPAASWTFGALCFLSSNQYPSFAPRGVNNAKATASTGISPVTDAGYNYAEPIDLNGDRLPGFQRLEIYMQYRFSWLGAPLQTTVRMMNGYGLTDPFVWELRQNSDDRLKWRASFNPPSLFPLYPVVSVSMRF